MDWATFLTASPVLLSMVVMFIRGPKGLELGMALKLSFVALIQVAILILCVWKAGWTPSPDYIFQWIGVWGLLWLSHLVAWELLGKRFIDEHVNKQTAEMRLEVDKKERNRAAFGLALRIANDRLEANNLPALSVDPNDRIPPRLLTVDEQKLIDTLKR